MNLLILAFVVGFSMSRLRSWPELVALLTMIGTTVFGAAIYDLVAWDLPGLGVTIGPCALAVIVFFGYVAVVIAGVEWMGKRALENATIDVERSQQWEDRFFARLRARLATGKSAVPAIIRPYVWVTRAFPIALLSDGRLVASLAWGVAFFQLVVAVRMRCYLQRLVQPSGVQALMDTWRPSILFLRPFLLDALPVSPIGNERFELLHVISWVDKRTFEEHLSSVFGEIGPVIAIGRPGEEVADLGAARVYADDDSWRSGAHAGRDVSVHDHGG